MFSHCQHLNKHGVSHLPQALILPVQSTRRQTQHEINSSVTRLHLLDATGCAATSAEPSSKALHGNKSIAGVQNLFKLRAENGLEMGSRVFHLQVAGLKIQPR